MKSLRIFVCTALACAAASIHIRAEALVPVVRCADTSTKIKAAFSDAANDVEGAQWDIRIPTGTYTIDAALSFKPGGSKDNKDFSMSGGWTAGCGTPPDSYNPKYTVLSFSSADSNARVVEMLGNNRSYAVRGIRFDHASTFRIIDPGCALFEICPDTDSVTVEFNDFRHMNQFDIEANDAHALRVRNNLFAKFAGSFSNDLVKIRYVNGETMPDVSFNTFARMQCGSGGNLVDFVTGYTTIFHHNIFDQTGCNYDLFVEDPYGAKPVVMRNNLYKALGGKAPQSSSDNLVNQDPQFVDPSLDNYNLHTTAPVSPAISAGMTIPELILGGLGFPAQDLDGPDGQRIIGANLDIGAFESTGQPPPEFVVSNTNDSGAGSLRQAIYDANHSAGFQKIVFSIPNTPTGCPHKILLNSVLDDIVDSVTIDGYSQPGSAKNSIKVGSSANLCVELGPASGTLAYGLRVPNTAPAATQVTIDGIAFRGGHSLALDLSGGTGHYVWGNAFGGVRPGGSDTLGNTNVSHLAARKLALGVRIGGDTYKERNYFGTSQLNAILLLDATSGGHTVENNYIGLDPGGAVPQPLGGNGISAQDSADITIIGNIIDAGDAGIRIAHVSATGYVIKGNVIGLDAYGGATASAANENGILITSLANHNAVGSLSSNSVSNTIANNRNAGVWIEATAGTGNVVGANTIFGNGTAGTGLGVDLGALGPLANDAGDLDGGANADQNTAMLTASAPNPDSSRQIVGHIATTTNAPLHVEIYRSPTCAGGDRGGDAKTRLGAVDIVADAAGKATFSLAVSGVGAFAYVTAITTNSAIGNTSEISPCFYEDTLFKSSLENGEY